MPSAALKNHDQELKRPLGKVCPVMFTTLTGMILKTRSAKGVAETYESREAMLFLLTLLACGAQPIKFEVARLHSSFYSSGSQFMA